MGRHRRALYRRIGGGMLRAAVSTVAPVLPVWPGPGSPAALWRSWLAAVWADNTFREAVTGASPDLARQVSTILDGRLPDARRSRRAALAVARYAIRYTHRSTPFGLFAGVGRVEFGRVASVRIGDRHEVVTRLDPVALHAAISAIEADPARMADMEVRVSNLARVQHGRVYVPSEGPSQFALGLTPALELVLKAARSPIRHGELAGKLTAEFPQAGRQRLAAFLADLLRTGLLRSELRAAATVTDPASTLPPVAAARHGVTAADVRLDADVRLPDPVAAEFETAATVLARLATFPAGTPAWQRYAQRFADRFGEGTEVGVEQLTDPDHGLGMPDGFGPVSELPRPMTRRDRLLLGLAGAAALEGRLSVTLTEPVIEELEAAAGEPTAVLAPHFELCAQVQSPSIAALDRGDFRIRVHTVSRAAGAMTGRFWHLLPDAAAIHAALPTLDRGARLAQLSFHPARIHADLLTRAPQVLPDLVSAGEFRCSGERVLFPSDLAVGLSEGRLYLAIAATGDRVELLAPTAVNFIWNNYTPPMVRFLAEISRAATPQVTWFDWGAAWTLPFTPALHYRRSILAAARWQLQARALPGRTATPGQWAAELHGWRRRAHVPGSVLLALDDQHLLLNLSQDMDLDLLRVHLGKWQTAVLWDAPPPDADGWIGGRAHSIVVPLRSLR
jgi:lantibiotic biosynthesis protein